MAYDEGLAMRVKAAPGRDRRLEEKRMFGGLCCMVGGKMGVSVGKDRVMCRIDPAIHDAALEQKGCRTVVRKGREYRGYVHVHSDAARTKRELDYWVGLSLDRPISGAKHREK